MTLRALLAAILLAGPALAAGGAPALPAAAVPVQSPAPAPSASPAAKPRLRCPCEERGYKALTPKGRALAAYWPVHREANRTMSWASIGFLFGYWTRDKRTVDGTADSFARAREKLLAAQAEAVKAGAIRVGADGEVELLVKPGVDYVVEKPKL